MYNITRQICLGDDLWYPAGSALMLSIILIICGCQEVEDVDTNSLNSPPPAFCGVASSELVRCPRPWLPYLERVPIGGHLELNHLQQARIHVGLSLDLNQEAPKQWSDNPHVEFSSLGLIKVFVKTESYPTTHPEGGLCEELIFSHIYKVVDAFDPQASLPTSEAIFMGDSSIIAWGEEVSDIQFGEGVKPAFQNVERALGPAKGGAFDIVSLGQGGQLTFYFEEGVANGPGADFTIFENSFSDFFLELAIVEVSTDGEHFTPLPHAYLGDELIHAFGEHDPTLIYGLAGKYIAGFGTPFDLSTLAWSPDTQSGVLDLHAIHYIKVIDIIGDGMSRDSFQHPMYDPYPTSESAGLDLEAIGVLHSSKTDPCPL